MSPPLSSPIAAFGVSPSPNWERSIGSAMPPAWTEQRGALFTRYWARPAQPGGKGEDSKFVWNIL